MGEVGWGRRRKCELRTIEKVPSKRLEAKEFGLVQLVLTPAACTTVGLNRKDERETR
jgi:hypothetical protein